MKFGEQNDIAHSVHSLAYKPPGTSALKHVQHTRKPRIRISSIIAHPPSTLTHERNLVKNANSVKNERTSRQSREILHLLTGIKKVTFKIGK